MVIVVREDASPDERAELMRMASRVAGGGVPAVLRCALGEVMCFDAPGITPALRRELSALPAVERALNVPTPYQLASRAVQPGKTVVRVGDVLIGGSEPVIVAGPCSVENEEQMREAATSARAAGASILRGGAFKPRTSPYSFQGLGVEGLELLARAGRAAGMPVVTEVMEPGMVEVVAEHADMLQVGSRNMQNYPLLREVGKSGRPVLLKRGFAATLEEWLLAAEYILAEGNPNVVLCERGIRSFDPQTRNQLDLTCVPLLNRLTHLPVLVDPSHGTGRRELVLPMGVAAIAAGADGLIVEMHPHPDEALSDSAQTVDPFTLRQLVRRARAVRTALSDVMAETDEEDEALVR